MILIAGLGNPGSEYDQTRHNLGYRVIDQLAKEYDLTWSFSKSLQSYVAKASNFILLKPATFMNNSGLAVKKTLEYYNIKPSPESLWIIHDELDLAFGSFKISHNKSSAGHNGVQSVTDQVRAQEYTRWRIGIGRPSEQAIPTSEYVLQRFTIEEEQQINPEIEKIVQSVKYAITHGVVKATNLYNQ